MSGRVNVYSIPQLSTALVESLPAVFLKLGYKQNYAMIDKKLVLGYMLSTFAAVSFILDRKFKWDQVLAYQWILVSLYVVFSIVYWVFIKYIERGIVYQGKRKTEQISVRAKFKSNYEPTWDVVFERQPEGSKKVEKIVTQLDVTQVFNEYGALQFAKLVKWFEEKLDDTKKTQ